MFCPIKISDVDETITVAREPVLLCSGKANTDSMCQGSHIPPKTKALGVKVSRRVMYCLFPSATHILCQACLRPQWQLTGSHLRHPMNVLHSTGLETFILPSTAAFRRSSRTNLEYRGDWTTKPSDYGYKYFFSPLLFLVRASPAALTHTTQHTCINYSETLLSMN